MMHAASESDMTSMAPSSSSPAATGYYVQSPSRDSNDEMDKYSASNASHSPMESPSNPRHSEYSSSTAASRVSGNRRRGNKHYIDVVKEEEGACDDEEDDYYVEDGRRSLQFKCLMFVLAFGVCFAGFCLIVWGASIPYKPQISIKSLRIQNLYYGEGSDHTGVPTKLITVNCSASLAIYNPATFFGIKVTSNTANLMFSQITVATGQLEKYYQPKSSKRVMWVMLVGQGVPLYGAGAALAASGESGVGNIPFKLEFEIHSRGYVVGKLVKTKHKIHVSCSLFINSKDTKDIIFDKNSCNYL